jgi:uncharacterized protein YegP (UPF0339 family)
MSARRARVEVYKSDDGWRWRFIRNGKVRADGGQGYTRHLDCIAGMVDSLGIAFRGRDKLFRLRSGKTPEVIRLVDEAAA